MTHKAKRWGWLAFLLVGCGKLLPLPDGGAPDASQLEDAGSADASSAPDASSPPDAGGGDDGGAFASAPHLAWPVLPNHGGHELVPLRVVTVIASDEPYAAELRAFGDAAVTSQWLSTFGPEYGLDTTGTHVLVTGPHVAPGTSFTQAQMDAYIANAVAAASPPPSPDGRSIYVLYLPPGTVLDDNGVPDTACKLVPYHTGYGTLGDGMAVLTRCPAANYTQLDFFTIVAAHEIAEAATDSNPYRNPAWELWADPNLPAYRSSLWNQEEVASSIELGDVCIGTRIYEGTNGYQRVFSNAAAALGGDPCVPALPIPFFSVTPDPGSSGWFIATPGVATDIALTGWSTAATDDWVTTAQPIDSTGAAFSAHLSSATTRTIGRYTYRTTNNGRPLTLTAIAPASAVSGWWGVVKLWSWHSDDQGNTPAGEDVAHEALIGLYVP